MNELETRFNRSMTALFLGLPESVAVDIHKISNEYINSLKADRLELARYEVDFVYEFSFETIIYLCRGCGEEHINIEEIDHSADCRVLKAEAIINENKEN